MGRFAVACILAAVVAAAPAGSAKVAAQEPSPPPSPAGVEPAGPSAPEGFSWYQLEGDGKTARADDILTPKRFDGVKLHRGRSPGKTLRIEGARTFETTAEGVERLVAVRLTGVSSPGVRGAGVRAMTKEQAAHIRGVVIDGWLPEFAELLAGVDGTHCVVELKTSSGATEALRALPGGLRVLDIQLISATQADLSPLAKQTELRTLSVLADGVSDWSFLGGMQHLSFLSADVSAAAAATVPPLRSLTSFMAGGRRVTDISFLRQFRLLRDVSLFQARVTDLRPLELLPELTEFMSYETPVEKVPSARLPKLKKFVMMNHRVPAEELRAFIAANPQCEFSHSLRATFERVVKDADAVRLRTGGLCHRAPSEERVLFESSDPVVLRDLIALFEFDDAESGGMCMCCGEPTLEFLSGGKIVTMLSLHHGASVRGAGLGGDARLTQDSSDAFCAWLRSHGAEAEGAGESRRAAEKQRSARVAAQDGVIGAERGHTLRMAIDTPAAVALLGDWWPDAAVRADVALRFVAVSEPGERDPEPASAAARRVASFLSDREDRSVVLAALERLFSSPETALLGAEAFCALDGKWIPRLSDELKAALSLNAAKVLFATQHDASRRKGRRLLIGLDANADARALLLSQLPPPAADGAPAPPATDFQMQVALDLFPRADEALRRRISALAETAVNAKRWQREIADALGRAR